MTSPWQLPKLTPPPLVVLHEVKPRKPLKAGERFGQWRVIGPAPVRVERAGEYRPRAYYIVVCSCGTEKEVARDNLVNGLSKSCGCNRKARHEQSLVGALKRKK